MRCCNKAQWEIRELMTDLKDQVKEVNPLIGTMLGANCEVNNYCPEGKDSCKNRAICCSSRSNSLQICIKSIAFWNLSFCVVIEF